MHARAAAARGDKAASGSRAAVRQRMARERVDGVGAPPPAGLVPGKPILRPEGATGGTRCRKAPARRVARPPRCPAGGFGALRRAGARR
ncbi:hypothetical protein GCM10009416_37470 [Craurococcus roseus]|uniref:Uncharacterized protein n=1 Tax=Craurococcus roseus TaxID=77585 RepID=A0ABP3QQU0_9PROT